MKKVLIGINHKNASVEIREKFYLTSNEQDLLLSEFKNNPSIIEAIILSTCNRTEIYASVLADDESTISFIKSKLFSLKHIRQNLNFDRYFYFYEHDAVIQHLFEVAAGLDSLIIGESQILGQLKASIQRSQKMGMLWKHFNVLSNMAMRIGKKAHTETEIGIGGASVSWSAVKLAEKKLGTLKKKSILVIGAGKMGKLTGSALLGKGFSNIYIMNRTFETAEKLASKINGKPVGFWDLKKILSKVDICICSVGAPHYIIEKETLAGICSKRKSKKLLLVDISVPRNIDPKVKLLSDVELVCIDQLDQFIEDNLHKRKQAMEQVYQMIDKKMIHYKKKILKIEQFENVGVGLIENRQIGVM